MSLLSTLSVAQSGLQAASSAISVVGNNVANASTEGYHAKSLSTSTATSVLQSGSWFGTGTQIASIARASDNLLSEQLVDAQGDEARHSAASQILSVVEAEFSETDASGVATALSEFFDALEALTADPADNALRMDAVYAADALTASVQDAHSYLQSSADDAKGVIENQISSINETLEQIASLQQAISNDADTNGQGDLLDQRDALISELADSIGVSVEYGEDNEVTLFLDGHAILNDGEARTLSYGEDSDGNPTISLSSGEGSYEVTDGVGGSIGGQLDALAVIDALQSDLDSFVSNLADAFNAQHASGYDANGSAGGDLFSYTSGSEAASFQVSASILDDASLLALAGDASAAAGDGDNLSAMIDIQDQGIFGSASQTAEEFVSSIYATVGQEASAAAASADSAAATASDLDALHSAITGVNLDDEAVALIQWQAAYQAAARVISVTDELLGELMEIAR